MQTPLLFRNTEASMPTRLPEKRGAIYTKPWINELILNMAGYEVGEDLATMFAVEPAAGEGASWYQWPLDSSDQLGGRGGSLLSVRTRSSLTNSTR